MTSNIIKANPDGVVLQGYHKKLKTMRRKYFVLYAESLTHSARLEYYDSEKKFKSRSNPKRTITLRNCFNIFRRLDTKHKNVISLSMKDEAFCIVLESEDELNKWLRTLLALQRGENTVSDPPKPTFEHVWQVVVRPKGLAEERGILGSYHVCLTMKSLTFIPIGHDRDKRVKVDFLLTTIRRCGNSQCYFYMEVGRYSAFGAGELWMETSDPLIAQNMHTMIINAMTNSVKNRDDNTGQMRKRSSSANETSKPISVMQIRQTTSSNRPLNSSPLNGSTMGRERCDSLPSRNRTASDSSNHSIINPTSMPPPRTIPTLSNRPHSMYHTNRHSHSPPVNTLSPSTGCSESEGSLSMDETDSLGHSLTPDESGNFVSRYYNSRSGGVIPEENCDDFWYDSNKRHSNERIGANQNLIRRGSPASHHIGSAETQGQYMDMYSPYSPCGSSPCDQTGGNYMPISPSGIEFSSRGLYTESSGGHSRASSLAEETPDGYVPMCPPSSAQDYVDMEQGSKQQNLSGFSSAASSCSITSGTPSTDVRFAEYPLDKVQSRFTPDDEDIQSGNERPIRTYSVGSRLEHNKRKLRVDMLNAEQSSNRVRAFSVGSRAKVPRCDMYRGGVYTPNLMSHTNNNYNMEMGGGNSISGNNSNSGKGKKSSSAPILVHKSQSSVDRMSDLMEIDFSKNSVDHHNNDNFSHSGSSSAIITPLSVRMSSFPVQVPTTSNNRNGNCINNSNGGQFMGSSPKIIDPITSGHIAGYVEMKPGNSASSSSEMKASSITSIKSATAVDTCGYLEMKPVGLSKSPSLSSSPIKSFSSLTSQKSNANNNNNNNNNNSQQKFSSMSSSSSSSFTISPKSRNTLTTTNTTTTASNDYMNISPPNSAPNSLMSSRIAYHNNNNNDNCHNPSRVNSLSSSSLSNEKLVMEVDDYPITTTASHHTNFGYSSNTPEGYMEMSFSKDKHEYKSSTSSSVSGTGISNNEMRHPLAGRSISSPIDIKSKDKKGFELSLSEAFPTGKCNRYRTDSADSNNVLLTATPLQCGSNSQAPTIFPFSPSSPLKSSSSFMLQQYNSNDFTQHNRKCLIDGTSGTLTISEDSCSSNSSKDEKCYNNNNNENERKFAAVTMKETKILNTDMLHQPQQQQQQVLLLQQQNLTKCAENVEALSHDYADMSLADSCLVPERNSNSNSSFKKNNTNILSSSNNSNSCSDYVNYTPQQQQPQNTSTSISKIPTISNFSVNSDSAGDYAIMKPVTTGSNSTNKKQLPIALGGGYFGSDRTKTFEGFKSIASSSDEMFLRNNENPNSSSSGKSTITKKLNSPKLTIPSSSSNNNNRTQTTRTNNNDDGSGYELLHMRSDSALPTTTSTVANSNGGSISNKKSISRPNSVNSEKISPLKANTATAMHSCRPNSVNSDCISQSSISTSSSTSTLCGSSYGGGGGGSSSSSSTLCGSKSQSPLTNSRPQSFSDTTITASTSRPDSTISLNDQQQNSIATAGNTTTTIVGVNAGVVQSRPPSVSSERELHYASLDLPPASSNTIITNSHHHHHCLQSSSSGGSTSSSTCCNVSSSGNSSGTGSNVITKANSSTSGESSTSLSPITSSNQQQPTFTYAQIDFNKSESLKQAMNAAAAAAITAASSSATNTNTNTTSIINNQQ